MKPDPEDVSRLIAEVAAAEIMPRFHKLEPGHVIEKVAGELVTIADRAAEERLTKVLRGMLPGSLVVGEEAVAADPGELDRLTGEQPVWIIDPIDGTTNFVEGRNDFGVMVCLAHKGQLIAGWIHRPVTGVTAMAEAGGGAWMDGARVRLGEPPQTAAEMTGTLLVGTFGDRRYNSRMQQRRNLVQAVRSSHSAAIEYWRLLLGDLQFSVFTRLLPWDHAAGVLLHREAGGHSGYLDLGDAYVPSDMQRPGMLLAPTRSAWQTLHATLLGDVSGL
jgi:fructose-1,6-bisphosphatase/inositol monophosphatase family enzyme